MGVPVYCDPHVTAERRWNTHVFHHVIGNVVFQIAVVLEGSVQGKLIQAIVGLPFFEMIHFQLKAVPCQTIFFYKASGVVSLCPESRVGKEFPVYDDIALKVGFGGSGCKKGFPVFKLQVNGVYPAVIEKARLITRRSTQRFNAQSFSLGEQSCDKEGGQSCKNTDFIYMSVSDHKNYPI